MYIQDISPARAPRAAIVVHINYDVDTTSDAYRKAGRALLVREISWIQTATSIVCPHYSGGPGLKRLRPLGVF